MSNSTEAPGPDVGYIIYTMGEIILALSAAIGNGLVIAAIILHRPLQTITNYFVASLAAADFLVGVLGIPCTLVAFNGKPNNYTGRNHCYSKTCLQGTPQYPRESVPT